MTEIYALAEPFTTSAGSSASCRDTDSIMALTPSETADKQTERTKGSGHETVRC